MRADHCRRVSSRADGDAAQRPDRQGHARQGADLCSLRLVTSTTLLPARIHTHAQVSVWRWRGGASVPLHVRFGGAVWLPGAVLQSPAACRFGSHRPPPLGLAMGLASALDRSPSLCPNYLHCTPQFASFSHSNHHPASQNSSQTAAAAAAAAGNTRTRPAGHLCCASRAHSSPWRTRPAATLHIRTPVDRPPLSRTGRLRAARALTPVSAREARAADVPRRSAPVGTARPRSPRWPAASGRET